MPSAQQHSSQVCRVCWALSPRDGSWAVLQDSVHQVAMAAAAWQVALLL